jgi:hypothetical protein
VFVVEVEQHACHFSPLGEGLELQDLDQVVDEVLLLFDDGYYPFAFVEFGLEIETETEGWG